MSQTDFSPEAQHYSDPDTLFMEKAVECVRQHLDDPAYDRERFAADMCMSSSTLYKKLRALTGQNVSSFVNSIRLKEACRLNKRKPVHTNQRTVRTFRLQHTGLLHTGVQKRIWHDLDRIQSHPNAWRGRHILHINSRQCTSNCKQTSNHKKNAPNNFSIY